jgi:hypothetical protein
MGRKIVEAIIEDGKIKHLTHKLPGGRLKVHLVYDAPEEPPQAIEVRKIVEETSGIYHEAEARKLRTGWERNVGK